MFPRFYFYMKVEETTVSCKTKYENLKNGCSVVLASI